MTIGNVNGVSSGMQPGNAGRQTDAVSRNLERQIADANKRLQELASNEEMTQEDKMKRRQEIQKEIADLNQQLRQRQMELRKEQQLKKASREEGNRKKGELQERNQNSGLSQNGMNAMLSADASMKQAKVQGSVAAQMEGRAAVLESEIKLDTGRGMSVERKKEALDEVNQKAQDALSSQFTTLSEAVQKMEDAGTEPGENRQQKDSSETEKTENDLKTDAVSQNDTNAGNASASGAKVEQADSEQSALHRNPRISIDLYL